MLIADSPIHILKFFFLSDPYIPCGAHTHSPKIKNHRSLWLSQPDIQSYSFFILRKATEFVNMAMEDIYTYIHTDTHAQAHKYVLT